MPVDLAFELSYLLSEKLSRSVEVRDWSFDPATARLCIKASVEGVEKEACIEVKPCRGMEEAKAVRCISKTLTSIEKLLDQLADKLK